LREGARIRCYLRVASDGRVEAVEFRAATCPAVWGILEDLQRAAVGRPVEAMAADGPRQWAQRAALPAEKLGRLLRVEDSMRAALMAWRAGAS
jgi:hypothetical protein